MEQRQDASEQSLSERTLLILVLFCLITLGIAAWFVFTRVITTRGSKTTDMSNMVELRKLTQGTQAFTTYFKVSHVPSRLKLCKYQCQYDVSNPLDRDSLVWLNQVWPRLEWRRQHTDSDKMIYIRIDWDGAQDGDPAELVLAKDSPPPANPVPTILQGDQCLVFCLGGIPLHGPSPGSFGFAKDPRNPAAKAVMTERAAPFFEFMSNRLVRLHGNAFYSYLDAFRQQPYAYFSSYGKQHGYNKYFAQFGDSDCSRLGIWPYAQSLGGNPKYVNPDFFQIISAGADGGFGRGSVPPHGLTWDPKDTSRIDPAGRDDQANFHALLLGVPAE